METYHVPNHIDNIGYASFEGCSSLHTFTGKFVSSNGRCLVIDDVLLAVAPAKASVSNVFDHKQTSNMEANYNTIKNAQIRNA